MKLPLVCYLLFLWNIADSQPSVQLVQYWNWTEYVNESRLENYFIEGSNCRIDSVALKVWNADLSSWEQTQYTLNTYDDNGNLQQRQLRSVESGIASPFINITSEYNANNDITRDSTAIYNDQSGVFEPAQLFEYYYDSNNNLVLTIRSNWNNGWNYNYRIIQTYNSSNQLLITLREIFTNDEWLPFIKNKRLYNEQLWVADSSFIFNEIWNPSAFTQHTYNADDQLQLTEVYEYLDGNFNLSIITEYFYENDLLIASDLKNYVQGIGIIPSIHNEYLDYCQNGLDQLTEANSSIDPPFPNPFADHLTIQPVFDEMRIINSLGAILYEYGPQTSIHKSLHIDTSNWAEGVYYVIGIDSQRHTHCSKIILSR